MKTTAKVRHPRRHTKASDKRRLYRAGRQAKAWANPIEKEEKR